MKYDMKKTGIAVWTLLITAAISGCRSTASMTNETAQRSSIESAAEEIDTISTQELSDIAETARDLELQDSEPQDSELQIETEPQIESKTIQETKQQGENDQPEGLGETKPMETVFDADANTDTTDVGDTDGAVNENAENKECVPYIINSPEFIKGGTCSIPETFERDGVWYRVTSIAPNAYQSNEDIVSLQIPDSITEVGDYAFAYCRNLSTIELGQGIGQFGYFVFTGCTSLQEAEIPDNITQIYGCFGGCTSLTKVRLPHNIQLATIDFADCSSLNTVYYDGSMMEWTNLSVSAPAPVMETTIDQMFDQKVKVVFRDN